MDRILSLCFPVKSLLQYSIKKKKGLAFLCIQFRCLLLRQGAEVRLQRTSEKQPSPGDQLVIHQVSTQFVPQYWLLFIQRSRINIFPPYSRFS